MASKKAKSIKKWDTRNDGKIEITFSAGMKVSMDPMPPLVRDAIFNSIPYPDPPMVPIKTKFGEKLWADVNDEGYKAACAEVDQERNRTLLRYLIFKMEGDLDPPDDWVDSMRLVLRNHFPEDAEDLRMLYVSTEIIKTSNDFITFMEAVSSSVTEEDIATAESTFRNKVEE